LTVIAYVLIGVGAILFYTERMRKREERMLAEFAGSPTPSGRAMPTDIHNFSGWGSGGRRADDNDGGSDSGGGDGD
jgi:hypothetical protein